MGTKEMTQIILSDKLIRKYIYPHHWISGSSTIVYPVSVWTVSKQIVVQVKRGAWRLRKCLKRIVESNPEAFKDAYFCKSDGSCPDTVKFCYI